MADQPLKPELSPEEQARAKFLEDFTRGMREPWFRRWLWHLIEGDGWCEVHGIESPELDGPALHKALGKRSLGLGLIQTAMYVGNENYMRMVNEARNLKLKYELDDAERKKRHGEE